ncbi:MAG: FABP family protein [Acidimicrobiales bacterium]|nr:FABP family protein [Acidimicrobiales bacterium]
MQLTLHEACEPLALILGEWRGAGSGHYPTIEDFEYTEEVIIGHSGKPFLTYGQKTKNAANGEPLHSEQGFLRLIGGVRLELVLAQPSGIVEIHEGSFASNESACVINLESIRVATTPTAKSVQRVHRLLRVEGDTLTYDVSMAAIGLSMQHHLAATLKREEK